MESTENIEEGTCRQLKDHDVTAHFIKPRGPAKRWVYKCSIDETMFEYFDGPSDKNYFGYRSTCSMVDKDTLTTPMMSSPHLNQMAHFKPRPIDYNSALTKCIDSWRPKIKFHKGEGKRIRSYLLNSLQNTVTALGVNSQMFKDSYIVEAGSMAEGTKIQHPDEFDFIVALPTFSKKDTLFCDHNLRPLMNDYLSQCTSMKNNMSFFAGHDKHIDNTRDRCIALFNKEFESNLSPNINSKYCKIDRRHQGGVAMTYHLIYKSIFSCEKKRSVAVDIAFCIPLKRNNFDNIYVDNHVSALRLKFCQSLVRKNAPVFLLLTNLWTDSRLFCPRELHCFDRHADVKNLYRIAKYVTRLFLPHMVTPLCAKCRKNFITSYEMKTVLRYMMDVYTDPADWNRANIGNRLVELFTIIADRSSSVIADYNYPRRIQKNYNVFNMSKCIFPNIEEVRDIMFDCKEVKGTIKRYWQKCTNEKRSVGVLNLFKKLLIYLNHKSLSEDIISPPDNKVSPPEDKVSPPETVFSPEDKVSPPEDTASPPEDTVSSPEDSVSSTEDIVYPSEDIVYPPEDKASPPEDKVSPPEDKVSPPEDKVSPPEDKASPPEDKASPPDDKASPPEDIVYPSEDIVYPSEDKASPPEDKVSPPEDTVSPSEHKVQTSRCCIILCRQLYN